MNFNFKPYVATDALTHERQLYRAVQDAVLCLRAVVRNYNDGVSINPQIDPERIKEIEKIISDEISDEDLFEERLSEARRGYDE